MTSTTHAAAQADPVPEADHAMAHVMRPKVLIGVFTALIVLTLLTVTASTLGLGRWEIWCTLGIATVKACLVALYFMHLRYDRPFHGLLVVFGLCFVLLFLGLTLLDSQAYQVDINAFVEMP